MQQRGMAKFSTLLILLFVGFCFCAQAQKEQPGKGGKKQKKEVVPQQDPADQRYKVEGGILKDLTVPKLADTVKKIVIVPDSIAQDTAAVDSLSLLSKREQRKMRNELEDSTITRHSRLFRDSIPISRMCAISMVLPGFSQVYNEQAWKLPILYGALGSTLAFGVAQNKKYSAFKKQSDLLVSRNASRAELDPVQTEMIKYNTRRQLLFIGALATYVYFIGDGALNYKGATASVKKATTLSTICPGAGQFYNKSFWKVPIVMGGFATMAYIIDFNNRGYQRFKLAYNLVTDGNDATVDEFDGRYSSDFLLNLRNNYRRNRDLCIILTGAFYLLNIVDAHVDAHLKDYDISDDLAKVSIEPSMTNFYSMRSGSSNLLGLSLNVRF